MCRSGESRSPAKGQQQRGRRPTTYKPGDDCVAVPRRRGQRWQSEGRWETGSGLSTRVTESVESLRMLGEGVPPPPPRGNVCEREREGGGLRVRVGERGSRRRRRRRRSLARAWPRMLRTLSTCLDCQNIFSPGSRYVSWQRKAFLTQVRVPLTVLEK